jgi:hypothetical protein
VARSGTEKFFVCVKPFGGSMPVHRLTSKDGKEFEKTRALLDCKNLLKTWRRARAGARALAKFLASVSCVV